MHPLVFHCLSRDASTARDPRKQKRTFTRTCSIGTPLSPSLKEILSERKDNADISIFLTRPME